MLGDKSVFAVLGITGVSGVLLHRSLLLSLSSNNETLEKKLCIPNLRVIGEGNGDPLQCSHLENPRDGGAWWAAIYGVAQSRRRLKRLSSSSNLRVSLHIILLADASTVFLCYSDYYSGPKEVWHVDIVSALSCLILDLDTSL